MFSLYNVTCLCILTFYWITNELIVWLFTEKGYFFWSEHSLVVGIFCLRVGPFKTSSMFYCTHKDKQITPYSTKLLNLPKYVIVPYKGIAYLYLFEKDFWI